MVIMKDLFISHRVARIVYGYPSVEASLWHLLMKNSWPPSRFRPILSSLCPSLCFKEVRWKHLRNPWLSPKAFRGEHS